MALKAGDRAATSGMTKAIYEAIDAELRPPLEEKGLKPEDIAKMQDGWRALSFGIATGVVASVLRSGGGDADFAETFSSNVEDASFWGWLAGFVKVFTDWSPTSADGIALKKALTTFLAGKAVPKELRGIIQ